MQYEHLRTVDLNLLIAFHALMEERSVTGAARRMFVSQPAMSRMVDRLQAMLHDELLIRTNKGYEPTYRASAIYSELQQMLPKLQTMIGSSEFDPAKAAVIFRIETSDRGASVLIPGLIRVASVRAPGVQIDVVPRQRGFEALEANEVDLVLGGPFSRSEGPTEFLRKEPLLRDKMVCLVRGGHPLAKRCVSLREYVKAEHILLSPLRRERRLPISFSAERQPVVAEALARLGEKLNVRVRVPYFSSLGLIVANTDLVATLPLQIARRVKTVKMRILPAPKEFRGVSYHQIWHSRNDSSPIHEWVRGVLRTLAAEVTKERMAHHPTFPKS